MTRTVVALYDTIDDANHAVRDLVDNNFDRNDISIMAGDRTGDYSRTLGAAPIEPGETGASEGAGVGAGIGAALGGIGGLLVGLGALVIPGIGPIIAAGPLAAALTGLVGAGAGALAGGVTGGLIGALVDVGVPEEAANAYGEGIRRGGTLVTVRTGDDLSGQAVNIMNRHHPVDINSRSADWRAEGWNGRLSANDLNDVTRDQESTGTFRQVVDDEDSERERQYGVDQNIPTTGDHDMTYGGAGRGSEARGTGQGYSSSTGMTGTSPEYGTDASGRDYKTSGTGPSGQNYSQGGTTGGDLGVTGGREGETHHDYEESRKRTDWGPSEPRGQMDETGQNVGTGASPHSREESNQEDYSTGGVSSQNLRTDDVRGQDVTSGGMLGEDSGVENTMSSMRQSGTDYDSTRMTGQDLGPQINSGSPTGGYRDFGFYDTAFQNHFSSTYGTTYSYDQFRPAYRYGYDLATDPRYSNRNWESIEPEAKEYWDERQPGAWDRIKDAVRHSWQEVKNSVS